MKFSSVLPLAIASIASAQQGFNIAAERPDGSCKSVADWIHNFNVMKGLPGNFRFVRVYASSDCQTLVNAVPAAMNTGVKLLAGVWATDEAHYTREKNAFRAALDAHGSGWLNSVSVGSEDLYRGDTTAARLAQQMNEIRTIVRNHDSKAPVGHVDTWTAWVNDAHAAVLRATDFVGFDGYPYYQNFDISQAKSVFDKSITATKNAIQRVKPGTPLWITETGWPVSGPDSGKAHPSVPNARNYWANVWCKYPNAVKYAFTLRDFQVKNQVGIPSFGVVGENFKQLYNLAC